MNYRKLVIQRPIATVIIFGLLATLAIPLYGHNPPPAPSCRGWACANVGQICGPGVPGAQGEIYVCSQGGEWISAENEPAQGWHSVAGHTHNTFADPHEYVYTQEDLDAQVAAATEGLHTQEDLDAAVAAATESVEGQTAGEFVPSELEEQVAELTVSIQDPNDKVEAIARHIQSSISDPDRDRVSRAVAVAYITALEGVIAQLPPDVVTFRPMVGSQLELIEVESAHTVKSSGPTKGTRRHSPAPDRDEQKGGR